MRDWAAATLSSCSLLDKEDIWRMGCNEITPTPDEVVHLEYGKAPANVLLLLVARPFVVPIKDLWMLLFPNAIIRGRVAVRRDIRGATMWKLVGLSKAMVRNFDHRRRQ